MLEEIKKTAAFVRTRTEDFAPEVGIILGTGLGDFADKIDARFIIEYKDVPGFPVSTVEGHKGRMIFGEIEGRRVVAMQGRFHYYEGYTMQQVTFPVRVMQQIGIKYLFVSNASGGINPSFRVGDLMVITDHINLMPRHDVISNLVYAAHGCDVSMNMCRGKVIYKDGEFLTIDIDRVKHEVKEYALPLLFG